MMDDQANDALDVADTSRVIDLAIYSLPFSIVDLNNYNKLTMTQSKDISFLGVNLID